MNEDFDVVEHSQAKEELSEEEKKERERQALLERVSSFNLRTITHRVAWILNHYPNTRDSDITLQLNYWTTFQGELYDGGPINPERLYQLTRLTSIQRARAKIQNEYKLFQASPEIRKRRGTLAEEEKEKAIEDKPPAPLYVAYMDDSGKHSEYLIVGSVWFLTEFPPIYRSLLALNRDFGKEFHFADASRHEVPHYKQLADTLFSLADAMSFKYISVPRRGLKGDDPYTDLYYHLLIEGVRHEHATGRAPLPRTMQSWIDAEDSELDQLRIANLTDRLCQAATALFEGQLYIDNLTTANSEKSVGIQVADLIAACVNRVLERPSKRGNHKDEIADYVCEKLDILPNADSNDSVGDMTVHIAL